MTKEEINEAISLYLHPEPWGHSGHVYDYFTDEAANARLLDKMRTSLLVSDWPGCEGWRINLGVERFGGPLKGPTHLDRKTAIVLAFLKFAGIKMELRRD